MENKTVYQLDRANLYVGTTIADESPMEPGVFLMPARTVETAPPDTWPDTQWPRWTGSVWELISKPARVENQDPVATLQAQLAALQEQINALQAAQ